VTHRLKRHRGCAVFHTVGQLPSSAHSPWEAGFQTDTPWNRCSFAFTSATNPHTRHHTRQKQESQSSRWKTEPLLKAPSLKGNIATISATRLVPSRPALPPAQLEAMHRWAGPPRGQKLRGWQLGLCKVCAGYPYAAGLVHCVQLKRPATNEERHFTHIWCPTQTSSWLILFLFVSV